MTRQSVLDPPRSPHPHPAPSSLSSLSPPPFRSLSSQLVSIFVNPTQFLPGEDLAAYPRPLKADLALLTSNGVDYAFVPDASEMYSGVPFPPHATFVDQARIDSTEEGKVRPTHFRGVATVVTKLFNIVQPDRAYFGQKDGMQCVLIQRMVRELNMPLDIAVVPTAREEDGLAKSSRNVFLSKADRRVAPVLYRALQEGQRLWDAGEVDADAIRAAVRAVMEREGGDGLVVQYVSLASMMSGEELTGRLGERQAAHTPQTGGEIADNLPHSRVLLSVAARVGQTRLIDNVVLQRVREAPEYTNE